jgi:hypothetical protein
MAVRRPRYSKAEHARRDGTLRTPVRPQVEAGNHGKGVAITINSYCQKPIR